LSEDRHRFLFLTFLPILNKLKWKQKSGQVPMQPQLKMQPMRILVVEDDPTTSVLLEKALREEGHTVVVERNGAAAVDIARSHDFEAIVLDVLLPGLDGFGVIKRLRQSGCQTPVLMLTALDTDKDVIRGLNLGSDDYLTKPFALDVFFARLKAVARRRSTPMSAKLSVADLELDPASREVRRGGRLLSLTRTEYNLLELLLRSAGRAVLREQIIDTVWGFGTEVESNTLDAFISSLRSKVEPPGSPKLIHTLRGVGYTLRSKE
jgi:DNA-binding response OmpR family regulator